MQQVIVNDDYVLRECERIISTLLEMPTVPRKAIALIHYIQGNYDDDVVAGSLIYNYGHMKGIQSEREQNKWNASACFHNMKKYIKEHNGDMPKDYDELKKWISEK